MLKKEHLIGAGFFILPFLFFSGMHGEPIRVAKEMGLIAMATLCLAHVARKKIHWAASLAVAFIGFNLCVTGFGPAQMDAVVHALAALMCAYAVLDVGENGRVWVLRALAFAGLFQSIYGFFQIAGIDPLFKRVVQDAPYLFPVGTMGQPTIYGPIVACGCLAALWLRHYIISAICFVAVISTTSSFSIGSLVAGVLIYLFLCKKKKALIALTAVSLVTILSLFVLSKDNHFARSALYGHNRHHIWKQAVEVTYENNPIYGFGLGSWKVLYPEIQPHDLRLQNGKFLQAHNDYVQIFFEGGFVGIAVTLLILAVFAYRLLFDHLSFTQRAFASIGVLFLVDSVGSFPIYLSPHGLILATCLVVVIARHRLELINYR